MEPAKFVELDAFAHFASYLDKATQNEFARGQHLCELLKQCQSAPLGVEEQILTIYTETNDYLDSLEIGQVMKFLVVLRTCLKTSKLQFQEIISSTKTFTEEAEAIKEQRERFILRNKQSKQIDHIFNNFLNKIKKVLKRFGFKSFKIGFLKSKSKKIFKKRSCPIGFEPIPKAKGLDPNE